MQILVLIKEVPDMNRVKFDSQRGVVDRASAEAEINPFDLNALQAAVNLGAQLAEQGVPCAITALTMGPPKAERTLRDAYARGADRCVLLTDRKFGGADTLATSRTLAAAARKLGYDLILCGEKTVDGDTAQVGPEVAELLDIPHCCYASRVCGMGQSVEVAIENLCGFGQLRRMELPALVSVTKNVAAPRLPTVKRKLASLEVRVETLALADLEGLSEEEAGAKGSPTKVVKIEVPPPAQKENHIFHRDYPGFSQAFLRLAARVGGGNA